MVTFRNPRQSADFDNWPSGGVLVQCQFRVHGDAKKGWRVEKRTTDKHGRWCKPKLSTYGGKAAIVDGSDGKTYILQVIDLYGFVKIMRHDFMDAINEIGRQATVFENAEPQEHAALKLLIETSYGEKYGEAQS